MAGQWHVPPGVPINFPDGTEMMRSGFGIWIYYNPFQNKSWYVTGAASKGYDVIEYDQPLCDKCWERYRRYTRDGT